MVADKCWSHMEVRLSILGCLAYMSYIEKVGDDVFWGFHVLLLLEPFAIHEIVMLGKLILFMIFLLLFTVL